MEMVGQPYRRRALRGHLIDYCSGENEQERGGSEHGIPSPRELYFIPMYVCKCVCSTISRVAIYMTFGWRLDQLLVCRQCCLVFCGHAFVS